MEEKATSSTSKSKQSTPRRVLLLKPNKGETTTPPAKVAPERRANMKWGKDVMEHGYCIVPSLLLRAQQRLGLNPTQLAVLLQLCDFWWEKDRKPFPSKEKLSVRLGLGQRQIQRYMAELEEAGLLKRVERLGANGSRSSNHYDLSGLVAKLKKLEPDLREAKERTRRATQKGGDKSLAMSASAQPDAI